MGQLHAPEWVRAWAARAHDHVDSVTTYAVIDSVRAGSTLEETMELTALDRPTLFKVVSQVGARCTQIAKKHTKATQITAGTPGSPATVKHLPGGDAQVIAAAGWVRSRREGDIRKAYAATLLAEDEVCALAVDRVTSAATEELPVRYVHFADLHAASRGVLPPLHHVVVPGPASDAYLRAWHLIDNAVQTATAGAKVLLDSPTPQAALAAVKQAFWLVPQATAIHRWALLCTTAEDAQAREVAEARLRTQLGMVRHLAQRQPHKLAPVRLEQLSATQMRAIAAHFGHQPGDGLCARTETAFESFATMARAALRELELDPA